MNINTTEGPCHCLASRQWSPPSMEFTCSEWLKQIYDIKDTQRTEMIETMRINVQFSDFCYNILISEMSSSTMFTLIYRDRGWWYISIYLQLYLLITIITPMFGGHHFFFLKKKNLSPKMNTNPNGFHHSLFMRRLNYLNVSIHLNPEWFSCRIKE